MLKIGDKVYCKTKDRGYLPGIIVNKGNQHPEIFLTEKPVWHVSMNGLISYWTESHMILVEDFPEDDKEHLKKLRL